MKAAFRFFGFPGNKLMFLLFPHVHHVGADSSAEDHTQSRSDSQERRRANSASHPTTTMMMAETLIDPGAVLVDRQAAAA